MIAPASASLPGSSAAEARAPIPVPLAELLVIVREYLDSGRLDAADRLLRHVLAEQPRHPEALHLSGYVAFKRGRVETAIELMEQALAVGANAPRQLCNLAEAYRIQGRLDAGLSAIRRAAALAPTDPVCHFNEAMLHYDRLDIEPCIRAARRAIALRPDMPEAHMRLGQALLLNGAFADGWAEYEWRYRIAGAQPLMPPEFVARGERPAWDGRSLGPDQRLLLIADQGFGDVLMFARFLPWAMRRAERIVVACSAELVSLLSRMFPGPSYFVRWADIPAHAAFCPFSGLPRLAETTPATIPAELPYVAPDAARAAPMRTWLEGQLPAGVRRVGLAWAGRPTHNNDRNRSLRLAALAPLAGLDGIAFVSLQKGPASRELADWPGPAALIDAEPVLRDFEDTAALLAHLDLLVCVDTSVGHLAGAMGRAAWIMLPFAPDWRWAIGRIDSPWYPSLRLFRQAAPRAWPDVIDHLRDSLADWRSG